MSLRLSPLRRSQIKFSSHPSIVDNTTDSAAGAMHLNSEGQFVECTDNPFLRSRDDMQSTCEASARHEGVSLLLNRSLIRLEFVELRNVCFV
jgi:hypothetical protein